MNLPTLLVVDDSEGICAAVSMLLEEQGIVVHTASTYQEGLNSVLSLHYDVILLDVQLGIESGLALAQEVRQHRPNSKIILMSGAGLDLERHTGIPMLLKPFTREELLDCLRRVVDLAA